MVSSSIHSGSTNIQRQDLGPRFPSLSWKSRSPVRMNNPQDRHLEGSPGAARPSDIR